MPDPINQTAAGPPDLIHHAVRMAMPPADPPSPSANPLTLAAISQALQGNPSVQNAEWAGNLIPRQLRWQLGLPDAALRALFHPVYRTLMSGTPFAPGTLPKWLTDRIPALEPSGPVQPLMQHVADRAADIGAAGFEAKLPIERMLGLRQLPGSVVIAARKYGRGRPPWGGAPGGN